MKEGTGGTRARAHVQNSPGPQRAGRRGEGVTARSGSEGPELKLPERAETPPEVAEGGRVEGNLARGFNL